MLSSDGTLEACLICSHSTLWSRLPHEIRKSLSFNLPEGHEDLAHPPNAGLGWGLSQEANSAVGLAPGGRGDFVIILIFTVGLSCLGSLYEVGNRIGSLDK